eukprot:4167125-Pyramimonas_sp.AAC.1
MAAAQRKYVVCSKRGCKGWLGVLLMPPLHPVWQSIQAALGVSFVRRSASRGRRSSSGGSA